MSGRRLEQGGLIDRARPLSFSFEGRALSGFAGDTLASALLANGERVVGRSFKYHRPRGLMAAGVEEPNALMRLGEGARAEVNLRATEIDLFDGLTARPVNCWPSARLDLGALNGLIGRFIPAGFYYKTFLWPDWRLFEPIIRRAAGLGRMSKLPDPDRYESRHEHCDVLVVGAGPAGLAAATAASRGGARVLLCEQDSRLGGRLLWDAAEIDGRSAAAWIEDQRQALEAAPEVRLLTRTTAIGCFDHNALALVERVTDHQGGGARLQPRQRLWQVRARRVILAAGGLERPLVFPGNDRPGVMLATAVRRYVGCYGVLAGERAVIFTNNDDAYATAHALLAVGGAVQALVDSRPAPPQALVDALTAQGVEVIVGGTVVATHGRPALSQVTVRDAEGRTRRILADLLAMSGGLNPTVHLFCQSGGGLTWDAEQALFKPDRAPGALRSVGAAAGDLDLASSLTEGHAAGEQAAALVGHPSPAAPAPYADPVLRGPIVPLWRVRAPGKAFVDFQNDVAVADIELAARENFVSVEHLKRYTTLGMAPDQGKTSNVNALAIMAELTGRSIPEAGTTRYRFPFTPVSFGALAGRRRGELHRPIRRLVLDQVHQQAGAVLEEYGGWLRPAAYQGGAETFDAAIAREVRAVREAVGLFDASPLGKIEVKGPDAAAFLDRIYANTLSTLKVGRARYGLMLNEQGVIIDDGVTLRLAEDHFLVGTTGAGAERITDWLEEWLQCEWPHLKVIIAPVTTSWAVLTLSGPQARAVLERAGSDIALGPEAFAHMSFREGRVADLAARVVRVSFTGEVSFEINVRASEAPTLWARLRSAGAALGLEPVGVEAWMLLRTEKGYLHVGADTDGTTTPNDVGWGHVLNRKVDFIGRRSLTRPENARADRLQLVGLETLNPKTVLPIGAHLPSPDGQVGSQGHVTSSGFSQALRRGVALAMVRSGRERLGEVVSVRTPSGRVWARIVAPGAYDPEGKRLDE